MRSFKFLWVAVPALLVCVAVSFCLLSPQTTSAQERNFGWQKVPNTPAGVDFTSVFMLSGRGGGLVTGKQGDKGVLYELDITALDAWRNTVGLVTVNGGSFRAPLNAAVLVGNDEVWAVGNSGLIVHRTAGRWTEVPNPVPGANLTALQMLGAGDEGWAAGYIPGENNSSEPVLLHYAGGRWERDNSITGQGPIYSLHFAQGGGWAVGQPGIWRYHNGAWTKEQEPNPCPDARCFETYYAVRAISADEAWVAGERIGLCGICVPNPYILHRTGGRWQISVDSSVQGDTTSPSFGRELRGVTFADPATGWAVGDVREGSDLKPYIAYYDTNNVSTGGKWTFANLPPGSGQLNSVIMVDRDHAVAVGTNGLLYTFGYGPQPPPTLTPTRSVSTPGATQVAPTATATPGTSDNPAERVPDPHNPNLTYFPLVGHTLGGGFRDYWQRHGGLAQFGYPLTQEFTETSPTDGRPYVTQYFERARFEYHPENRPPYDVLLGLLGRTITLNREGEPPFRQAPAQFGPGTLYFSATGHNMPPQFATYWQSHGGLPVYGYPISEAFQEISPTDGRPYLVQYFERNRLEYHPELPEPYRVSLGLLGVQILQQRGWLR